MKDYEYLTIGEMARYSGIPAKTLRYYDEIGLFSPAYRDEKTEYRYYLRPQLEQVLLLQSLKALGMPLRKIKEEFDNMSSRRYAQLLEIRANSIEREIASLTQKRDDLRAWISEVQEAGMAQLGRCYLRRYPQMRGYIYHARIENRTQHELAMRGMEALYGNGSHLGRVRRIIAREDILSRNYLTYSGLFIPYTSVQGCTETLITVPEQDYAVIFAASLHESSAGDWEQLLDFIDSHGLAASGDAYRSIPVEKGISRSSGDYVAKIAVPVCPKEGQP